VIFKTGRSLNRAGHLFKQALGIVSEFGATPENGKFRNGNRIPGAAAFARDAPDFFVASLGNGRNVQIRIGIASAAVAAQPQSKTRRPSKKEGSSL